MLPPVFLIWLSLFSFTCGSPVSVLVAKGNLAQYVAPVSRSSTPTSQKPTGLHRTKTNYNDAAWLHDGETTPSFFSIKNFPLKFTPLPPIHLIPESPSLIDVNLETVTRRPRISSQLKGTARRRLRSPRRRGRPRRKRNGRKKRYMYEDVYDWDYEATELDYELEEKSEVEKFLDKWHKEGMKVVGILCVFMTCFCTCCCVCRTALRSLCNSCAANCQACGDRLRCRDPSYRKFCKAAGPLGLKMSYSDYKKLKGHYEEYAFNKYGEEAPKM